MKIAVNTRLLVNDIHGGIEWFTYECMKRITKSHPEHQFIFLFDRPFDTKFIFSDNITPIVIKPATIHPLFWYLWFEHKIPGILKKTEADIFLSPDGMMPLKTKTPCVPVIHDINFYHRKHDLPHLKSLYYRKYFRKNAKKAIRVVTVSEYSKKDMVDSWNIEAGKIDVVYNGASDEFDTNGLAKEKLSGNSSESKYFLFVGNLSPRKNVPGLIRAYDKYRSLYGGKSSLLITGEKLFLNRETDRAFRNSEYRNDIHFTGRKSREELKILYSRSIALVFVPWFEGFGIPVVEAMKCGTAVIASDTTSIPEISGNAAILVDPSDTKQIAESMAKVEKDNNLRKDLIEKGYRRAAKYTWDNTANLLWSSIDKTLKSL